MSVELSSEERAAQQAFRAMTRELAPFAAAIDRDETMPPPVVGVLARHGCLGHALPSKWGGAGALPVTYGLLCHELGRVSASIHGVVNVNHMAALPIARWGGSAVKEAWLPQLASGAKLAAIAITEPEVGSDAASVETHADRRGDDWILCGRKKWITCGQIADVFLVLARTEAGPAAFVLDRRTPGLSIAPIRDLLGCRGYVLAELELDACRVPAQALVGKPGFGLSHVVAHGLDAGRYGLAWGCVGVAQACLDACLDYAERRRQFGAPLRTHQLVQRMLTKMIVRVRSAYLLCWYAGRLRESRSPQATVTTAMAKYLASTTVGAVARDAIQVHGAAGCSAETPVARYFRDARIMEIIEGTSQIQEMLITAQTYATRVAC